MENFKERKKNRLKNWDYSAGGGYFVTICTKNKKHLFWNKHTNCVGADIIRPQNRFELSQKGEIVKTAIENIPKHYKNVYVDKYVIMPNHIHIIIFINNPDNGRIISAPTRSVVIGQMKRYASKMAGETLWQKSFYDHIIRSESDYLEKRKYIENNPALWREDEYFNQ